MKCQSRVVGPQRPDPGAGDKQVRRGRLPELQRRDHQPARRYDRERRQDHPRQLQPNVGKVR